MWALVGLLRCWASRQDTHGAKPLPRPTARSHPLHSRRATPAARVPVPCDFPAHVGIWSHPRGQGAGRHISPLSPLSPRGMKNRPDVRVRPTSRSQGAPIKHASHHYGITPRLRGAFQSQDAILGVELLGLREALSNQRADFSCSQFLFVFLIAIKCLKERSR